MTLLRQRDHDRVQRRLELIVETRQRLKRALSSLIPGQRVIVFGSVTKPGTFNDHSDVDVALESEPAHMSVAQLQSELEERLQRPVDIVLLNQCRFCEKITREGEVWMP